MVKKKIEIGAVFAAILLVSIAFVPAVSAKAETRWEKQVLESNGITVNDFDTKLTKYEKVGNQIHYSGTFKFDVEKNVGNEIKRLKSSGTFIGIIDSDTSIHTEYSGENFKVVTDISKIGEDKENFIYQSEEVTTVNGKINNVKETFKVPKEQINAFKENSMNSIKNSSLSKSVKSSGKVKVDLPNIIPPGSHLLFNDVKYSYILAGASIVGAIASALGVGQAVLIGNVIYAVGSAVPTFLDIEPADIYIDFYSNPYMGPFAQVDYYYKST